MSLKVKISFLVAGLLTAAVGALTAALVREEGRALARGRAAQEESLAAGLAEVCRGAVTGEQDLMLANYLRRLKNIPAVREAMCLAPDGRVIGHTDLSRLHTLMTDSSVQAVLSAESPSRWMDAQLMELSHPVRVGTQNLGAVRVVFDRAVLEADLKDALSHARRRILRLSGPVLGLGFLASFLMVALALRSVSGLVEGVRIVARGKWDHRLPEKSSDEMGTLAKEFNLMAEKLGELDHLKQDFVHSITHDLKSPLSAVKAATELLQAETEKIPSGQADARAAAENLFLIRQNADRLMNLVTSILEVAHIESGVSLRKTPARLEDLADRVVRALGPAARAKGLSLETVVADELPPLPMDEGKMERVIGNLVGNALKFTEKGAITVTVSRAPEGQSLRVEDTGPGLPLDLKDRLFTKFSRGERPAGKKIEGAGLGLSIVKGLVEAHGGAVSAANRPEGGAVFSVIFPEGTS